MTKFLNISTDNTLGGSSASDVLVASQKAVKDYVDQHGGGGGSVSIDDLTITRNSDQEIQAVAVIDQNSGSDKIWTGDSDGYEAIVSPDSDTFYAVTDDIGAPATVIAELAEGLNDKVDVGHQVIDFQTPTAGNNYTWYRKYADGWVEQGGVTSGGTYNSPATITMPITMTDTNYCIVLGVNGLNQFSTTCAWKNKTTTTFQIENGFNGSNAAARITNWQVSGIAA